MFQKYIAIPYKESSNGDEVVYNSCQYYDLDYSSFSDEELLHWNRSVMEGVYNTSGVKECDAWVYDQSVMVSTAVSDVSRMGCYCVGNLYVFLFCRIIST